MVFGFKTTSCKTMATTTIIESMAKSCRMFPASADLPSKPVITAPADIPARFINP